MRKSILTASFLLAITIHGNSVPGDSAVSLTNATNFDGLILEEGITAELLTNSDGAFLKISADANPKKTPTAFLATVGVVPGTSYTYFTSARKESSSRILHLVGSDQGNIVWPGAEIEQGVARTHFTVPDGVSQIMLGISFLYPEDAGQVLIEDIGLFEGNIEVLPQSSGKNHFAALRSPKWWAIGLFMTCMLALVVVLHLTYQQRRKSKC